MAHGCQSRRVSVIERARLGSLIARERASYAALHPKSVALFRAADHLFGHVPMTWMAKWSGGFPLYLERAFGNRIIDVDGHEYVDFALGDTGAMAGHSPKAVVDAVTERLSRLGGATAMLPTADGEWVGAELTRRFGLPLWSFTLTATDANRWALRLARLYRAGTRRTANGEKSPIVQRIIGNAAVVDESNDAITAPVK